MDFNDNGIAFEILTRERSSPRRLGALGAPEILTKFDGPLHPGSLQEFRISVGDTGSPTKIAFSDTSFAVFGLKWYLSLHPDPRARAGALCRT